MKKYVPFTLAFLLAAASTLAAQEQQAAAPAAGLSVAEIAITTNVVDRQPADNLTAVSADVGTIYCWTRITGAAEEVQVEHVWYKDGVEMARVPLHIAGSNWRTWSSKNIEKIWTGPWRVDVVGPDGAVIESVSFNVTSQ